jgi:hypothetical protein
VLREMIRYGGPVLRHADEERQASFDITCEIFRRFLGDTARRSSPSPTNSANEAFVESMSYGAERLLETMVFREPL